MAIHFRAKLNGVSSNSTGVHIGARAHIGSEFGELTEEVATWQIRNQSFSVKIQPEDQDQMQIPGVGPEPFIGLCRIKTVHVGKSISFTMDFDDHPKTVINLNRVKNQEARVSLFALTEEEYADCSAELFTEDDDDAEEGDDAGSNRAAAD